MMQTYSIPKFRMDGFEKIIKKMSNKAKRLGLEPLEFEVVGSETKEYDVTRIVERKIAIEFIQVTVQGEAPKIEGYNLVAMVERVGDNNLVKRFDSGLESKITTQELANIDMSCNHCDSNRRRKYVFVLENANGEVIQVGKSCLKDFTNGNLSATSIASYYAEFNILDELQSIDEEDWGTFNTNYNSRLYSVRELVGISMYITDTEGYVPTSEWGMESTKDKTFKIIMNKRQLDEYEEYISRADEVIDYYKNIEANSDYLHNLKALFSEDYVEYKYIGYVVSAYNSMLRAKEREKERERKRLEKLKKENRKESQYVGEIGERREFELEYNRSLEFGHNFGYYGGTTYMHFFYDKDDNVFVWSTTKELDLEQGENIKLVGIIKEHKEYRDTKQTVITRCKIK